MIWFARSRRRQPERWLVEQAQQQALAARSRRIGEGDIRVTDLAVSPRRPGLGEAMTGGLRRLAAQALLGLGPEELRAITSLPWNTGSPMNGGTVTVDRALSLAPVYSAGSLLARSVAALPLHAFRMVGSDHVSLPNLPPLFQKPSVQGTLWDWIHRAMTSLVYWGEAIGLITGRDGYGYPTGIEWLDPAHIYVLDSMPAGRGSFVDPIWYFLGREIPQELLIHIPWFTLPGRVRGLSPIGAYKAVVETGLSAQEYSKDWYDAGGVPPGTFQNKLQKVSEKEATDIKARLVNSIRAHEPIVYGTDWEYKPIAIPPHEARFVESMRLTATQVAGIYGIYPPERIGGETGRPNTYSNAEADQIEFQQTTLLGYITKFESTFFQLLPQPVYVKFNVDATIRVSLKDRHDVYLMDRQMGLKSRNEIRHLEDMEPISGGNDYTPLLVEIQEAKAKAAAASAPAPSAPPAPGGPPQPPSPNGKPIAQPNGGAGRPARPFSPAQARMALEVRRYDPWDELRFNPNHDPHTGQFTGGAPGIAGGLGMTEALVSQARKTGGFSYQVKRGMSPTGGGYMVSPYPARSRIIPLKQFGRDDLVRFAGANRELLRRPEHYLGAWISEGKVYLDVSVRALNRQQAVRLGRRHNQIAVWDLKNGTDIPTGGTGRSEADLDQPGPPGYGGGTDAGIRGDPGDGLGGPAASYQRVLALKAVGDERYSPAQPRVPAGHHGGGEWTSGPGGFALATLTPEQEGLVQAHLQENGITAADTQARLESLYEAATPATKAAGRAWYGNAHDAAEQMAHATGHSIAQSAAVIAALSPRTPWQRNLTTARALLAGHHANPKLNLEQAFALTRQPRPMVAQALATLHAGRPVDALTGPKRRSFYLNIVDPKQRGPVTVDGHMFNAMTGGGKDSGILNGPTAKGLKQKGGSYAWFADQLRVGARKHNLRPDEYQAIVWVQDRGGRAD